MRIRHIFVATALVLVTFSAHALNRIIPAPAKRGLISFAYYPTVLLDGQPCQTSPGLRIYNQRNLTQVSSSLAGYKFEAKYTFDARGQLNRIWILTIEEIMRAPRSAAFHNEDEETSDSATNDTSSNTEDASDDNTASDSDENTDEE